MAIFICAGALCSGCATARDDEVSELRRGMHQQMITVRNQLRTSGASAAQLRDFDRAIAEMDRVLRQTERQMRALERQAGS